MADEIDRLLARIARQELVAQPDKYARTLTRERAVRTNRETKTARKRERSKAARKARRNG